MTGVSNALWDSIHAGVCVAGHIFFQQYLTEYGYKYEASKIRRVTNSILFVSKKKNVCADVDTNVAQSASESCARVQPLQKCVARLHL